jgi:hypothetical protein
MKTSPTFGVIEFHQYFVAARDVQKAGIVLADAGDFFLDGAAEEVVAVASQDGWAEVWLFSYLFST